MAEWIYSIHPPRDNFAATMTRRSRRCGGARRGVGPQDHGGGPGDRGRLRPGRTAPLPGGAAAGPGL